MITMTIRLPFLRQVRDAESSVLCSTGKDAVE